MLQTSQAIRPVSRSHPKIDHRLLAPDRREIPEIAVAEPAGRPLAGETGRNDPGDIGALLLGHRRHTRQTRSFDLGGVADHKNLGVTGQG